MIGGFDRKQPRVICRKQRSVGPGRAVAERMVRWQTDGERQDESMHLNRQRCSLRCHGWQITS